MAIYNGSTTLPWYVVCNYPEAGFDAFYQLSKINDYRLISLAMSSGAGARPPLYSGIFVKRAGPYWRLKLGLTSREALQGYVADQRGKGYFPRLAGAHRGTVLPETFAVMVEQGAPESRIDFALGLGLPGKIRPFDEQKQDEFLRSCALYGPTIGDGDDLLRYALVLEKQPAVGKIRWNAFGARDPSDTNSTMGTPWPEQFGALVQGFWRPDLVCVSEPGQGYGDPPSQVLQFGNRFYSIWRDDALNAWSVHDLHGEAQLSQLLSNIEPYRMPIRLQLAGPPGPQQRIMVMLAVSDEVIERVTTIKRVKEKTPKPAAPAQAPAFPALPPTAKPFSDCDDYVLDLIKRESIRCAQLAIAYNGRLVHAAALTHAEPGYPTVTNEHVMRVGSISKALTGIAIGHAWGNGLLDPFDQSVGSILSPHFTYHDDGLKERGLISFLAHCSRLIGQDAALKPMDVVAIANYVDEAEITDEHWVDCFLNAHPDRANLFTLPPPILTFDPPPPPPHPVADYNGAGFALAGQCHALAMGPDAFVVGNDAFLAARPVPQPGNEAPQAHLPRRGRGPRPPRPRGSLPRQSVLREERLPTAEESTARLRARSLRSLDLQRDSVGSGRSHGHMGLGSGGSRAHLLTLGRLAEPVVRGGDAGGATCSGDDLPVFRSFRNGHRRGRVRGSPKLGTPHGGAQRRHRRGAGCRHAAEVLHAGQELPTPSTAPRQFTRHRLVLQRVLVRRQHRGHLRTHRRPETSL